MPDEILDIPWRTIRPMPGQPREYFDQESLKGLADSIKAGGQLVPAIVVRLSGDRKHDYELIDGQRRWYAVQIAGLETLKARVVNEPDTERRFLLSVVANQSRENNHPLEIARACERLRKHHSVEQIALFMGCSVVYIYKYLRLLNLHPDIQDAMHPSVSKEHRVPTYIGMRLASLPREKQLETYTKMRQTGLSLRRGASQVMRTKGSARTITGEVPYKFKRWSTYTFALARLTSLLAAIPGDSFAAVLAARDDPALGRFEVLVRSLLAISTTMLTAVETEKQRRLQ